MKKILQKLKILQVESLLEYPLLRLFRKKMDLPLSYIRKEKKNLGEIHKLEGNSQTQSKCFTS